VGLGETVTHVVFDADVHLHWHRTSAGGLDDLPHAARLIDLAAVVDRDRGPVGGELERGAASDPRRGAGDQRSAAFQEPRVGRMEAELGLGHPRGLPD
jgi:hypothetical protein